MRSSLVYKYSCARCASEYVGSTSRALHIRICEHQGRSFRTGTLLTTPPHSNIREHLQKCNTTINSENFTILDTSPNISHLRILESLYINQIKFKFHTNCTTLVCSKITTPLQTISNFHHTILIFICQF